jgi:SAM-dependent methyltransferase
MNQQRRPSTDTAEEVRDFYERYPYPPPTDSLEKYRQRWQDRARRRADHHLFFPAKPYTEDHSILIAGCGTSQAAKYAVRWPGARIVGIDFSATSVRCTEELKKKYDLNNLEVRCLPLERVSELRKSFDRIVCTGVLHHLPHPDAGLLALRDVLAPEGAMHLMVYAPYGRTGIYMLQEFCRRIGSHATDEGIRDLVASLGALPPGHPLVHLLREAPDFRNEAALADALLHPQDRAYSVPQFFDFVENAGLVLGRWVKQAPYSARCGVMAKIPQASRLAALALPDQFAAIELFRGTMVRHSAVVYRSDHPAGDGFVGFDGDAWRSYVPIRVPDTICVEERLPPGAAAVLINPAHTYRDLYLPIDAAEKRLFEAIDGTRTIAEIVQLAQSSSDSSAHPDGARAFFEQLWWYDEVVFDAAG